MTKAELRKFQTGTRRRFIFTFIIVAFAIGLLVAWIAPTSVIGLLSIVMLLLAALVFEMHLRQTRLLKRRVKPLPRKVVVQ